MVSSNWALKWVPYPMQVVGKSAKPIPVMLLGVLVGRKSYSLQRYLFVLIIVVGVVLFMFQKDKAADADHVFGLGEILLLISLLCDGLTAAVQERMRRSYSPSAKHMMYHMNAWSSCILIVAVTASGEAQSFVPFAQRNPDVLWRIALMALTGSMGQLFIFIMVSSFGPLPCSIATTTRKFFTVLFSVLWFQNPLTALQWGGAALVFVGLFADAIFGKNRRKKPAAAIEADAEVANGDTVAAIESGGVDGDGDGGAAVTATKIDAQAANGDVEAVIGGGLAANGAVQMHKHAAIDNVSVEAIVETVEPAHDRLREHEPKSTAAAPAVEASVEHEVSVAPHIVVPASVNDVRAAGDVLHTADVPMPGASLYAQVNEMVSSERSTLVGDDEEPSIQHTEKPSIGHK